MSEMVLGLSYGNETILMEQYANHRGPG